MIKIKSNHQDFQQNMQQFLVLKCKLEGTVLKHPAIRTNFACTQMAQ